MIAAWKVGDWVVFDLAVGQIKEIHETGGISFSDGFCETSGQLASRMRPLTLRSKRLVETFDIIYGRLRQLNGEAGFNYPDIHRHFSSLALLAIDGDKPDEFLDRAQAFVRDARDYKTPIQGIGLFRRKVG